ncbi:MAG: SUMF1/EgtB/PvdO family nonheme iron enzyme [Tannerellaceae bacterium]|nr:SUMF1/EgtB/PvdO family nonheme iron enzyme [Tannerellaceae bacterium]
MKRLVWVCVAVTVAITSCGRALRSAGGEVTGVRSIATAEPAPYGMVLIKRGAFEMGPAQSDSLWGIVADRKGVSFDAFWMDQTEITNAKYRQFVHWVRDSIIRERLADPEFGGNDLFKITEDRFGEPVTPYLNWSRPIPWKRATEDEQRAIESVYHTNPATGERKIDAMQMFYRYEWYDYTAAAMRKNQLDLAKRVRNTDIRPNPTDVVMISKDTAYFNDNGNVINETITRPLSSEWDFLHTRIVNIYPDENCWVHDFNNSYNEPYVRMYFSHPGYDDYPVVGISHEQAIAFCVWRTNLFKQTLTLAPGQTIEPFRLPTEGEWEYAARAGKNENKYPWANDILLSSKGCFLGNFKPGEGDYTQDGHIITSRVGAFSPNEFGLYDMAGNVAEWTSTSYAESGPRQMSDLNPELRYEAAREDPYAMKKKVVRGGSWKDVGQFIRSDLRTFEYQNETRSYIGFRCARTQMSFGKKRK